MILACWLVIIGIHLVFYYASLIADPYYYPYLLVSYPFPLFHGPFLYFYTASLTNQHPYLKKHFVLHFVPALVIYLVLIPFFLRPHAERLTVFTNHGKGYEWVFLLQLFHCGYYDCISEMCRIGSLRLRKSIYFGCGT